MGYAERLSEFIQCDDGRVALPLLQTAEILLTEPGPRFQLFLSQSFLAAQARKIPPHKPAHVHAQTLPLYIL